jgi:MFS family permease
MGDFQMEDKELKKALPKVVLIQAILIGILYSCDVIFGFFEQNFFNTYLVHVLELPEIYISIMVSLSAAMGLIMNLMWGIFSDNTRSKYGRRRPYLLFGGIIAGIAMITFAFAPNYLWCLFLDVIIIGIASNAYYVSERALVPDIVEPEYRGRANGIINAVGFIGLLIGIAAFLLANELFAVPNPRGEGNIINQEGYLFVLSIGGGAFIFGALIGFIFVKEKPVSELPPKKGFFVELKEIFDLEEFRKQNEFYRITLALTIFRCGISAIIPFLFIFIFSLGLTTLQLLMVIVISFPVLIVITMILGKLADKYGRKKYIPASIIITSLGFVMIMFVKNGNEINFLLLYIFFPFVLVGILGLLTPMQAWAQDLLPEEKRGKFLGVLNIVFTVSQIIGVLTAGIIATIYGLQWIFIITIMFFIISIPFFLRVKETLFIEGK